MLNDRNSGSARRNEHRYWPFIYSSITFGLSFFLLQFNGFINPDGVEYIRSGINLVAGIGLTIDHAQPYVLHPPFYPFLIGCVSLLVKYGEWAAHLISILCYALSLIPLFLLTEEAYSRKAAHWFSLLYLSHGFLLIYSNLIIAEPLLLLLISVNLFLIHRLISSSGRPFVLAGLIGLSGGLSYLTHPLGALFFGAALLSIFCLASDPFKKRFRLAALSLACFSLFAVPYLMFVHQATSQTQLSGVAVKAVIQHQMNVAQSVPYLEAKKIYEGLADDKIHFKLDELAKQFNLADFLQKDNFALVRYSLPFLLMKIAGFGNYMYAGFGFLLIGAGLFGATWDDKRKKTECLRVLFLLTFAAFAFSVFEPRYYFPFLPLALIWCGQGLETLRGWLRASFQFNERKSLMAVSVLCGLLIAVSAWYLYGNLRGVIPPSEHRVLGLWMRENILDIEKETVAAQVPYAAFYAGANILQLPYVEKFDDLVTYLHHYKAKYFIVGDDLDTPVFYSYRFLLDAPDASVLPSSIVLKHTVKNHRKVMLYECL